MALTWALELYLGNGWRMAVFSSQLPTYNQQEVWFEEHERKVIWYHEVYL